MNLSHPNIGHDVHCIQSIPTDLIDMNCVYFGSNRVTIDFTTSSKMYFALIIHNYPID